MQKVAIIGAGAMGSQIAFVTAMSGIQTNLVDVSEEALKKADDNLRSYTTRLVEKNQLDPLKVEEAFCNLHYMSSVQQAVEDAGLVIEAIIEKLEAKQALFQQLSECTNDKTILATNSSTIVSSKLIEGVNYPERVCNIHFFNPAIKMELVEVVRGPHTAQETIEKATQYVKHIHKVPVVIEKEIYGFIVNRLLNVFFDEAIYLYEQGYASFEDIDIAVKKGLNHPMGPFELIDYTGIDVNYFVRQVEYEETGDESKKPQQSLVQRFEGGELGKKTKKGFIRIKGEKGCL